MTGAAIDNIPTCGLVQMSLPIESWSEIEERGARLEEFDYPKKEV